MKFRIVFWDILLCKIIFETDVSEVCAASIIRDDHLSLMMIDNYFTRQYIPEDNSDFTNKFLVGKYILNHD
jgi:hypothetical protein